jgi:Na+/phosphate symporter
MPVQIEELKSVFDDLKNWMISAIALYQNFDKEIAGKLGEEMDNYKEKLKIIRKAQIKRIKNQEIGTRNSQLYLNHLGELRDIAIFTNRLVKIYEDFIINTEEQDKLVENDTEINYEEQIQKDDSEQN